MAKKYCKHIKYCLFKRAFGYCIKSIGEECEFYPELLGGGE